MKTPFKRIPNLFLLAVLLCACEQKARPLPTDTPIPPTGTHTITVHSHYHPQHPPTYRPSPENPPAVPQPKQVYIPAKTLAVSPTPVPGWTTYTNEYLGYSFNYPSGGSIYKSGAQWNGRQRGHSARLQLR